MLQISGFKNKNVFFATFHITELNKTSYMHNYSGIADFFLYVQIYNIKMQMLVHKSFSFLYIDLP